MSNETRINPEFCATILPEVIRAPSSDPNHKPGFVTVLLSFIPCMGVIGNTLIILSVAMYAHMQTVTNAFIVSLAVADMCVATLVMPYSIYMHHWNRVWTLGKSSCLLAHSFRVMTCTASIYNLCCLAVDRYLIMCRPFMNITPKVAAMLLITGWVIPILLSFVPLMNKWNHLGIEDIVDCIDLLKNGQSCELIFNQTYAVIVFFLAYFFPLLLMAVLNWRIYHAAIHQFKEIHQVRVPSSDEDIAKCEKIAKALAIIMACFGICWSPFYVCSVINPFINYAIPISIITLANWAGFINSVINPILWYVFDRRFKFVFHKMFWNCCNSRCCK